MSHDAREAAASRRSPQRSKALSASAIAIAL
jgi:hypothetical protein